MTVLRTGRAKMCRLKRKASRKPRTSSTETALTTKIAVTLTASRTSSSPKARAKLAKPFQVKLVCSSRWTTVRVRGWPLDFSTGLPAWSTTGTFSRPVTTTFRSTSCKLR